MTDPTQTGPGAKPRGQGRLQLVLLFLAFFVPVAAAWLIYFFGPPVSPEEGSANGTLIHPARPLPEVGLQGPEGRPLASDPLRERWTILYHRDGQCAAPCIERAQAMNQTRLALGEEMYRVQVAVLLAPDAPPGAGTQALPEAVRVLTPAAKADYAELRPVLRTGDQDADLYLVDPLGNVMMFYPVGGDPKAVLRDLRHLLKASRIG